MRILLQIIFILAILLKSSFAKHKFYSNSSKYYYALQYSATSFAVSPTIIQSPYYGNANIALVDYYGSIYVANTEDRYSESARSISANDSTDKIKWSDKYLIYLNKNNKIIMLQTNSFISVYTFIPNITQTVYNVEFSYCKQSKVLLSAYVFLNRIQVYKNQTVFLNQTYNTTYYNFAIPVEFSPSCQFMYYIYRNHYNYNYYINKLNLNTKVIYSQGQNQPIYSVKSYDKTFNGDSIIVRKQDFNSYYDSQIIIQNKYQLTSIKGILKRYQNMTFTSDYKYLIGFSASNRSYYYEDYVMVVIETNTNAIKNYYDSSEVRCCDWKIVQQLYLTGISYERIIKIDGYGDKILVLTDRKNVFIYDKKEVNESSGGSWQFWSWNGIIIIGVMGIIGGLIGWKWKKYYDKKKLIKQQEIAKHYHLFVENNLKNNYIPPQHFEQKQKSQHNMPLSQNIISNKQAQQISLKNLFKQQYPSQIDIDENKAQKRNQNYVKLIKEQKTAGLNQSEYSAQIK